MPTFTQHLPPWLRRAGRLAIVHGWRSYPAFYVRSLPRALRPTTFNDHLVRKLLFDRRPLLTVFADKVRTRDHVREVLGDRYLTHAYAITDDARTIDWNALPRTYVCKATHGSGGVIVVTDDADPEAVLPPPERARWNRFFIRPEHADPAAMTAICEQWLRTRFGWGSGSTHEWQYRDLVPHVLIEELLEAPGGGVAFDHKCHVFHGTCEFITVVTGRMGVKRKATYRPDWTPLPLRGESEPGFEIDRPKNLDELVRVAETLAADTDFLRVDLYRVGERIVVGELTNVPNAGRGRMEPEVDRMIGRFWRDGAR